MAASQTAAILLERLSVASEQDRSALSIALAGALSNCKQPAVVEKILNTLPQVSPQLRDSLIEGLGRMSIPQAGRALSNLASQNLAVDDRRKVAEALGGHPAELAMLRRLTRDVDPSVRANAIWSLGLVGKANDVKRLAALVAHHDVAVAGNAIAALGRLASGGIEGAAKSICGALDDSRSYVRANALAALDMVGKRCGDGSKSRQLLATDLSPTVRMRAARLIRRVASSQARSDARGLRRCLLDDRSGQVAKACRDAEVQRGPAGVEPVVVFVVPDGRTLPTARAPFALELSDGRMRLGLADRRGAVFELCAPRGVVQLTVPATRVK
ncbi:MAG: hypothetical protein CSA75_02335 [Sorangium cellulosum]|nr:MAG: hypothetical protein CSA75_02335 [Sorangium cellulosum]